MLEAEIRDLLSSKSEEEEHGEEMRKQGERLLGVEEEDEADKEYERASQRFEERKDSGSS
jgi:hypothetical protein